MDVALRTVAEQLFFLLIEDADMRTIADINKSHQQFWKKQSPLLAKRILDKDLFDIASEDMQSEIRRGVPPYSRKTMEQAFEDANRARKHFQRTGGALNTKQQVIAKVPRGKVTPDGMTTGQLIELLVLKPKNRDLSAKELWPLLRLKLKEHRLNPRKYTNPKDPGAYGYTYRFKQGRKKMSFKTLSNLVARLRGKKSH